MDWTVKIKNKNSESREKWLFTNKGSFIKTGGFHSLRNLTGPSVGWLYSKYCKKQYVSQSTTEKSCLSEVRRQDIPKQRKADGDSVSLDLYTKDAKEHSSSWNKEDAN